MSLRRASFSRNPPYLDDEDSDMDFEDDNDNVALNVAAKPRQDPKDDEVDELADDNHPSDGESEVDHDDDKSRRDWPRPPPALPPPSVLAAPRPPQPPLPAGTFQSPRAEPGHLSLEYQRHLSIIALEKERERRDRRRRDKDRPEWREDVWGVSPAPSAAKRKDRDEDMDLDTVPPRAVHPSLPPIQPLPTQSHPHHKAYPPPPHGMFGVLKSVPAARPAPVPPPQLPPPPPPPPPRTHTAPTPSTSRPAAGSPWLYAGEEPYDEDDSSSERASRAPSHSRPPPPHQHPQDDPARPKKRRRTRVALSCAECKRRKIKCDRAQPCTPCARRGDQSNCKWAVMESKEGAVSRAEWGEVLGRLERVERALWGRGDTGVSPVSEASTASLSAGGVKFRALPPPTYAPHAGPSYANHHASGSGFATNGPVYPPPAPMSPGGGNGARMSPGGGNGTRTSPIKVEDVHGQTPRARSRSRSRSRSGHTQARSRSRSRSRSRTRSPRPSSSHPAPAPHPPSPPSSPLPTLRLLPAALRPHPTPAPTTFPLSDADWEQMTSVALTGANKQRGEAGGMHVDVTRELEALVGVLPGRGGCDAVWGCYVDRLEWQHCIVHPGAFQQMYDSFWACKTHAERAACTPIAWLALLLVVMSHGLAGMRVEEARAAGIAEDTAHWRMLCTQLWIASERALALDNFSHAVTLEVVQTLVLLSYRAISLDPKGWFHQAPILAMAIRLAMCIGLSNVPGDKAGEVPPPGLYRRELWRRIWYNIVYLDWRFSVPMGETYFINSYHYNTVPPANLDWNDMADGVVFRPKARSVFTSSSMFLAKVHNAHRVRDLCDALNLATRNGQQDVSRLFYEHEIAVNDTIAQEPQCLIEKDEAMEGADKRVQWARIGHTLELDYRAIQIHRSSLVADFREARARGVCIDTAEKMLDCFVEGKMVDAPSAWWWYGYTACVVLMMEQYYADLQPAPEVTTRLNQRLDNIMSYVSMQRSFEEVTVRAWDGILILETLIAELQKRRIAAAASATSPSSPGPPPRRSTHTHDPPEPITRVSSSSPVHAFRKWILNVMPFLKLPPVPGLPLAHPRQRDMDAAFWDAILDIDTELHKSSRRGNFGKG